MADIPVTQTGIVQLRPVDDCPPDSPSLLVVSHEVAVPRLLDAGQVLVRVLAVALNPTDFKMPAYFPEQGTGTGNKAIGCDFCGIVERYGPGGPRDNMAARLPVGARVCGGVFPYGHDAAAGKGEGEGQGAISGAFAQYVAADADQLLQVPDEWDDAQGAALGGIGWATCVLGLFVDPEALFLPGRPSRPVNNTNKSLPVLVYGGATATGTMACQLLKLSGHAPIAVNSPDSALMVREYGAAATVPYSSPTCAEEIRSKTPGKVPLRHALDCVTSPESVSTCFAAIGRAGGRYACLEACRPEWRTRRAVRVREVMGFEGSGRRVIMGGGGPPGANQIGGSNANGLGGTESHHANTNTYSRKANAQFRDGCIEWAAELQDLLDRGLLKPHPPQEVAGGWDGITKGLGMLSRGEVRGKKLAVKIPPADR